jgi:predicted permease
MSLRRFFRRAKWDAERRQELDAYLQIEIDAQIERGVDPVSARARAHRKLGNTALIREEIYVMNTMTRLESIWLDVKFGARALRKSPGFATVALLSLALGIGANAAIFQLLDAVRLRTLPVDNPDAIVELRIAPASRGRVGSFRGSRPMLTNPLWEQIREQQASVTDVFAYGNTTFELSAGGESRPVYGAYVSGGYFAALEARPVAGRLLGPADDVRGCAAPGVVVSHGFWQREFGGAADVTSRPIRLDGRMFQVAGVVAPRFFGVDVGRRTDVYVPICAQPLINATSPALDARDVWWLAAFGRLKPGVSAEQATAELAAKSRPIMEATLPARYEAELATQYVENTLMAEPAATGVSSLRTRYSTSLIVLLSIAGLVFLIACANLANLMLARASTRAREIAVRLAIGASRARIFRQLIAESLLLAGAGAAAGVVLAMTLSRVLVAILTSDGSPWALNLTLDWRLLGFGTGLAIVASVLFGLTPAWRATRIAPGAVVNLGGRGLTADRHRLVVRRILVAGQVAVSLVLVVAALLFVGTLRNLGRSEFGFSDRGVLVVDLDLRPAGVSADAQVAYQADLTDRLLRVPGTASGGSAAITPISGSGWNEAVVIDGQRQEIFPMANRVSPGFFETLRIPFVAGRNFDDRDRSGTAPVAIVNEAFRERFFAGNNPIGRQFKLGVGPGQPDPFYEIVGVVRNTKYSNLRESFEPQMYFAAAQETDPIPYQTVLLRTDGDPDSLRSAVASAVGNVHPSIVITFTVMATQVQNTLLRERLMASLSAGFAVLAVVLAAVGLYGLMAYGVARRRNEIGIRMALGATRSGIVRLIVSETAWLVAAGLAVGLAGAVYASRAAETLLFGLRGSDPWLLAAASAMLAVVAGLAALVPTSRAARLNPTTALRD